MQEFFSLRLRRKGSMQSRRPLGALGAEGTPAYNQWRWSMLFKSAAMAAAMVLAIGTASAQQPRASDAEIRQAIIDDSIARTPGNCPCPFNSASNGSRCGGRSSYSRGGGNAPVCYADDVTPAMIKAYRSRRGR